jgi:hypothetical protein
MPSWIRIRNLNADPDPATQINADPDPKPCPDPHRSAFILIGWIQEGKYDPQKYKKVKNVMF